MALSLSEVADNNNDDSKVDSTDVAMDNNNNSNGDGKVESSEVGMENTNTNTNNNDDNNNKLKRGRGRPPGSKNKPKIAAAASAEPPQSGVEHQLVEVGIGEDVLSSLSAYAVSCGKAVGVVQASGLVSCFRLLYHQTNITPLLGLEWELITLSGTFLPTNNTISMVTATMVGSTGNLIGGRLQGHLIARSPVSILVATFNDSAYHRLPSGLAPGSASGSASGYFSNSGWTNSNGVTTTIQHRVNGTLTPPPAHAWPAQSHNAHPN